MLKAEKEQLVEEKELLDMEKRQQKRKVKILEETNKRMKRPTAKPSNFPFTVGKLISNYETECGDHLNKYLRKSSIKKKITINFGKELHVPDTLFQQNFIQLLLSTELIRLQYESILLSLSSVPLQSLLQRR